MRSEAEHRAEFGDFTEEGYRQILEQAQDAYAFARFGESRRDRHVLWRHDVDVSMHRAAALARIERDMGVTATYFLYPRGPYYNLLESSVRDAVARILDLGHDIGLHFDPACLPENADRSAWNDAMERERALIELEFGVAPRAISFHLYGVLKEPAPADDLVCGMVNAYGESLKRDYGYVSDSNGVWLHRRLPDVLREAKEDRLQVLTHPEWWTPEVMAPRARLQRAIDGYAEAMGKWYDDTVAASGRPNLR